MAKIRRLTFSNNLEIDLKTWTAKPNQLWLWSDAMKWKWNVLLTILKKAREFITWYRKKAFLYSLVRLRLQDFEAYYSPCKDTFLQSYSAKYRFPKIKERFLSATMQNLRLPLWRKSCQTPIRYYYSTIQEQEKSLRAEVKNKREWIKEIREVNWSTKLKWKLIYKANWKKCKGFFSIQTLDKIYCWGTRAP